MDEYRMSMDEWDLGATIAERNSVQEMPCAALDNQQEHSPNIWLVSREVRHSIPHLKVDHVVLVTTCINNHVTDMPLAIIQLQQVAAIL